MRRLRPGFILRQVDARPSRLVQHQQTIRRETTFEAEGQTSEPACPANAVLTTVVDTWGSILDVEMPDQAIWPAQVVCRGLAWTRAFS